jgi:hypothetical protein
MTTVDFISALKECARLIGTDMIRETLGGQKAIDVPQSERQHALNLVRAKVEEAGWSKATGEDAWMKYDLRTHSYEVLFPGASATIGYSSEEWGRRLAERKPPLMFVHASGDKHEAVQAFTRKAISDGCGVLDFGHYLEYTPADGRARRYMKPPPVAELPGSRPPYGTASGRDVAYSPQGLQFSSALKDAMARAAAAAEGGFAVGGTVTGRFVDDRPPTIQQLPTKEPARNLAKSVAACVATIEKFKKAVIGDNPALVWKRGQPGIVPKVLAANPDDTNAGFSHAMYHSGKYLTMHLDEHQTIELENMVLSPAKTTKKAEPAPRLHPLQRVAPMSPMPYAMTCYRNCDE